MDISLPVPIGNTINTAPRLFKLTQLAPQAKIWLRLSLLLENKAKIAQLLPGPRWDSKDIAAELWGCLDLENACLPHVSRTI